MRPDREWKGKRSDGDLLDNHDSREADGLYEGKEVNSTSLDMAQVDEVRLVLDRHRYNIQSFYELIQCTHTVTTAVYLYQTSPLLVLPAQEISFVSPWP